MAPEGSLAPAALVMQRLVGNQAMLRQRGERRSAGPTISGLPGGLRSQLEARGGVSLADVRVHRGSPDPGRHEALAFTRGPEIHLGPGQERHLPHEAWHAVQQRQGRVPVTGSAGGVALNDDVALEREAVRVGAGAPRGEPSGAAGPAVLQRIRALPDADSRWRSDLNPGAVVDPGEGYIRVTSFSSAADTWTGSLGNRDHAYVGIEYVDDLARPHTVFTDLTHDGVRYSDDTSSYASGLQFTEKGGKTARDMISKKLMSDTVVGTSYKVSATQAVDAAQRARDILGQFLNKHTKADADTKYKFSKRGTNLGTDHAINCARFAQKVLKAAGIEISAGLVAKTPFEVANQKDASKGLKLIDATEPELLDVADTTKHLSDITDFSGKRKKLMASVKSRMHRQAVDDADLAIIADWVAGGWSAMNKHARGTLSDEDRVEIDSMLQNGKAMPTLASRVNSLSATLGKLAGFEGSTYRVARALDADVYGQRIQPGDYISDRGFTASSMIRGGQGGASAWGNKGLVHFEIKGHSGRDISQHSPMAGEREVVFLPNTTFKVEAIKIEDGTFFVVVREVTPVASKPIKNSFDGTILRAAVS